MRNELDARLRWRKQVENEELERDYSADHPYYIERDGETPIGVFKAWSTYIEDVIMPTK